MSRILEDLKNALGIAFLMAPKNFILGETTHLKNLYIQKTLVLCPVNSKKFPEFRFLMTKSS